MAMHACTSSWPYALHDDAASADSGTRGGERQRFGRGGPGGHRRHIAGRSATVASLAKFHERKNTRRDHEQRYLCRADARLRQSNARSPCGMQSAEQLGGWPRASRPRAPIASDTRAGESGASRRRARDAELASLGTRRRSCSPASTARPARPPARRPPARPPTPRCRPSRTALGCKGRRRASCWLVPGLAARQA